jgi:predicted peptidase
MCSNFHPMRLLLLCLATVASVSSAAAQSSVAPRIAAPSAPKGYLPRIYSDAQGGKHPFFVFVPAVVPAEGRPPVMLFLHGSGERGDNNVDQLMAGIGPAVWKRKKNFPFVVVLPQCRTGSGWLADGDDAKWALGMLKQIQAEFGTDPDRVILTGLSMGGSGTWSIAAADPSAWSAIVPMCSRPAADTARAFADAQLPIWNFCGDQDRPETVEANRAMAAALQRASANAKYTEYSGVGHNCWDNAYGTDELYTWMLAQSKSRNRAAGSFVPGTRTQ